MGNSADKNKPDPFYINSDPYPKQPGFEQPFMYQSHSKSAKSTPKMAREYSQITEPAKDTADSTAASPKTNQSESNSVT